MIPAAPIRQMVKENRNSLVVYLPVNQSKAKAEIMYAKSSTVDIDIKLRYWSPGKKF